MSVEDIEKCARGSLRFKVEELVKSIQGFFEDHHRFQLRGMMRIISELEQEVHSITERLRHLMKPHEELISRLDQLPGVNEVAAQSVISNLGVTLKEFPSMAALSCWAGLCPGNNESAGKQKSGRHPVRSHPFKTIMVEIAWAAVKKKDSYYKEKYYRLRSRLGPRKAIIAIAHRITKAIYHVIKKGASFRDLGRDYLDNKDKVRKIRNLMNYARKLGYLLVPIQA